MEGIAAAPGTPSDRAAYAPYIDSPPKRGRKSVVNRCLVVANIFDGMFLVYANLTADTTNRERDRFRVAEPIFLLESQRSHRV